MVGPRGKGQKNLWRVAHSRNRLRLPSPEPVHDKQLADDAASGNELRCGCASHPPWRTTRNGVWTVNSEQHAKSDSAVHSVPPSGDERAECRKRTQNNMRKAILQFMVFLL